MSVLLWFAVGIAYLGIGVLLLVAFMVSDVDTTRKSGSLGNSLFTVFLWPLLFFRAPNPPPPRGKK